jgi:hypothetical protein
MERMQKQIILTLVAIFLTAAFISTIQPAKASVEEVATSASITIQPGNVIQGQPFTVVVQIYPLPPSNTDVFNNISVTVTSAAQGVSGYGPWNVGPLSSDTNGTAIFPFPQIGSTIAETGGGRVQVHFPGQYFGNTTIIHYQAGDWQKSFLVSPAQTPTPTPSATVSPTPLQLQTPFPTPTVPELSWLAVVPLLLSVFAVTVIVIHRKAANFKQ